VTGVEFQLVTLMFKKVRGLLSEEFQLVPDTSRRSPLSDTFTGVVPRTKTHRLTARSLLPVLECGAYASFLASGGQLLMYKAS